MKTLKEYGALLKQTNADKLLLGFVIFYLIDCIFIWQLDPDIQTYGDALWMGFNVFTSIGLGDYTVTTPLARFATVLLGIYGSIMEAFIPGLIASRYISLLGNRRKQILQNHQDEIQNLSSMSKEDRAKLSSTIRKEGKAV